jgi:hypothetical protein
MKISPRIICQWLELNGFSFIRSASVNNIPVYAIYGHGATGEEVWAPVTGPDSRAYDVGLRREWPDRMTVLIFCIATVLSVPQVEVYQDLTDATD